MPLAQVIDVGLVAVALGAEHVTEPPERADHLVADQQYVVLVADLADAIEVPGRRREAAARVLDRFEEDGGDRVGALVLDRDGDLVGGPAAERGRVVAVDRGAVDVRVRHPEGARDQRLERRLQLRQSGDRQRAVGGAVVRDRAADHLVLGGFAGQLEVLLGQLPGGLDRLAATAGEEDPVQVARRVRRDPLGQLDRLRMRVRPEREERQLGGLLGRGLGELGAPVAELADEQAGQRVEVPLAAGVVDVRAVAADDDGDLGRLVAPHPGEMHPEVVARGLLQTVEVGVVEGVGRHHRVPHLRLAVPRHPARQRGPLASDFVLVQPISWRCQQ